VNDTVVLRVRCRKHEHVVMGRVLETPSGVRHYQTRDAHGRARPDGEQRWPWGRDVVLFNDRYGPEISASKVAERRLPEWKFEHDLRLDEKVGKGMVSYYAGAEPGAYPAYCKLCRETRYVPIVELRRREGSIKA